MLKGRQSGSGRQQHQTLAWVQIVGHKSSYRFFTDQYRIANFQVLQARGQGAVLYLDREKFRVLIMVRAGDRIGPQQRFTVYFYAQHDKVAIAEAKRITARGAERKQPIIPMRDVGNVFGNEGSKAIRFIYRRKSDQRHDVRTRLAVKAARSLADFLRL